MEMSPGGDMVQRIMVEYFVVMKRRRSCPMRDKIMRRYDQELLGAPLWCKIGAAGELDCFSAHIRLREPDKSKDKGDYPKVKHRLERRWTRRSTTVPQRWIYRSRKKGCRCKSTDSRAMGLAAPWYHRGGTFVESSIRCSHGGRALVIKGAEEVENSKANSKYQDRAEGQRPRNFIRLVSLDFSSR
ncbi:hypothetical protein B296_00037421 [Ensete ventricosum]|uniref:Uncharacterized protein n=1 Tax=Ensete ventricosum TaxID=4639 RepID=A0A426X927_ENSVE|nr:hypothetical protein B296_00037421 [Ensete ventricosum]